MIATHMARWALLLLLIWGGVSVGMVSAQTEAELRTMEEQMARDMLSTPASSTATEGSPTESASSATTGEESPAPSTPAGGTDATGSEGGNDVNTGGGRGLCSMSYDVYSPQLEKGKVVVLDGIVKPEDGEPALRNTYICTNLLEPIPYSVLSEGDLCLFRYSENPQDGAPKAYMVLRGPSTELTAGEGVPSSLSGERGRSIACDAVGLESGLGAIERYVSIVYRWATMVIGVIAVVLMVVGGIMMSLEGANPDIKGTGISMIKNAIIAILILFLAGALLRLINPIFFS